jgi:hypothetical protein
VGRSAGVGSGPGLAGSKFVKCAVGSDYADLAGGLVEDDAPVSFVDPGMVVPAQKEAIIHVGLAAAVPGQQVMGVGPSWRCGAAGAAAVAGVECLADPVGDESVGEADFEG